MTRLYTGGWENGSNEILPSGIVGGNHGSLGGSVPVTSPVRSGQYAGEFTSTTTFSPVMIANTRTYSIRAWIRFPAAPSAAMKLIGIYSSSNGIHVTINTDRSVSLVMKSVVKATSAPLAVDTWHRIEFRMINATTVNDFGQLIVNGVDLGSFYADSGMSTSSTVLQIGRSGTGTFTIVYDDIAINDDLGTTENSWPPPDGKVVMLRPVADDGQFGGWTNGVYTTDSLWDALNNVPPAGVSVNNMTATSQIVDYSTTTGDSYDVQVEPYSAKVGASDGINVVHALAFVGLGANGTLEIGVQGKSNPAIALSKIALSTSVGNFPGNAWAGILGTPAAASAVDRDTPPVLRIVKVPSSSYAAMCCYAGLLVEFVPGVGGATYDDIPVGTLVLLGTISTLYVRSDSATGTLRLLGTIVEQHIRAQVYNDIPIGTFTLGGVAWDSTWRDDTAAGTLKLTGTLTDQWIRPAYDAPVGTLALSGTLVEGFNNERNDAPIGTFTIIGANTDVNGRLDQVTGKLVLSGQAITSFERYETCTGSLQLRGTNQESHAREGYIFYDDYPAEPMTLSGRLVVPTEHEEYGIGSQGGSQVRLGRVVGSLTGRVT